jgi:diketogulonate reductase-like aldo/keto reductase
MLRTVRLPNETDVPALGQGTWYMGEGRRPAAAEADALKLGIELGLTLIDTAEMYADGGAEKVVGAAIAGQRDKVYVVSKVYPHNASRAGVAKACERSLQRMKTDRIDLYLLHWGGSIPLAETVEGFEALQRQGKIGAWGVSNLDVDDMAEVASLSPNCMVDQVLYNPEHRGIEHDLMPWCVDHRMALMAYTPIGQAGRLLRVPALTAIAARHNATPAQIALAWGLRHPHVICIPKASDPAHIRENVAALDISLSVQDLAEIDSAFPPPKRKQSLAML